MILTTKSTKPIINNVTNSSFGTKLKNTRISKNAIIAIVP